MPDKTHITAETVRELLDYDPEIGFFTWKPRGIPKFDNRFAGRRAGAQSRYEGIMINHKRYSAHRLAWFHYYGEWPDHIDHIDGDGLNNRIANLRSVTNTVNSRNQRMHSTNTSGFNGVYLTKNGDRWWASIKVDGKQIGLGTFENIADAAEARKAADIKYGFTERHGH